MKEGMKMKSSTMNLILAATALVVASTAASAQTLKVEIPFAFTAQGKLMPAGNYTVTRSSGEASFQISSRQASVVLLSQAPRDPEKKWQSAKDGVLQFACANRCALAAIWTHKSFPAHQIAGGKVEQEKSARLAFVQVAMK
jgi:hypothetical protein